MVKVRFRDRFRVGLGVRGLGLGFRVRRLGLGFRVRDLELGLGI